jgi:septum site-determining protein MinC
LKKNTISIKGRGSGLIEIRLTDDVDYQKLREDFIAKLKNTKGFLRGANPNVIIWGRKMTKQQKADVRLVLDRDYDINSVKFSDELTSSEKELIDKGDILHPKIKPSKMMDIDKKPKKAKKAKVIKANKAVFEKKTIRNGQRLEIDGDYTLVGDVNDGAEIFATGSVAIFGTIRGLVHAGCGGDDTSIIIANRMMPNQLRIAKKIVAFPKKRKTSFTEMAKIDNDNIVVVPLD